MADRTKDGELEKDFLVGSPIPRRGAVVQRPREVLGRRSRSRESDLSNEVNVPPTNALFQSTKELVGTRGRKSQTIGRMGSSRKGKNESSSVMQNLCGQNPEGEKKAADLQTEGLRSSSRRKNLATIKAPRTSSDFLSAEEKNLQGGKDGWRSDRPEE